MTDTDKIDLLRSALNDALQHIGDRFIDETCSAEAQAGSERERDEIVIVWTIRQALKKTAQETRRK